MPVLFRRLLAFTLLIYAGFLSPSSLSASPAHKLSPSVSSVTATPFETVRLIAQFAAQKLVETGAKISPEIAERLASTLPSIVIVQEADAQTAAARTGEAVIQVSGVLIVGLVVAFLVLVTALGPLEGVIRTVEADISGAFWRGVLAQVITLPVIAGITLLLALTLLGLVLIPVVVFASTLAIAGVCTLGILAVAAVIGRARDNDDAARTRARLLRAIIIGYAIIWLPWVASALLVSVPVVGIGVRIVALAWTWVIMTAGAGAVIRSRGGTRIPESRHILSAASHNQSNNNNVDWATPTPIPGVVSDTRFSSMENHVTN